MPSTAARLLSTAIVASSALLASAQSTIPLAAKSFSYPDGIPYKVDTDDGPRGIQTGINLCNATTEGQDSRCQTSFINSIEDFCLWAPPEPDSIVGNTEGEMVAWCTQPGRGTRLIPEGALRGVQFTKAPSYVQVVGFIDQTQINIQAGDYGGEMDPHGADRRGNPLGGLLFSQAFGSGNGSTWTQVVQWHNFMGGDMFCLKACDPADENDWHFCEHIFDRIGCAYNAPADYANINGTFTSCESENQMYPGVYVNSNGQTVTYTQPPESLGPITTIPYTAEIPSSSQCTTYTSSNLWTQLAAGASSASTSAASDVSTAVSGAASSVASGTAAAGTAASSGTTRAAGAANNAQNTGAGSTGAASVGKSVTGALAGLAGVAAFAVML